MPNKKVGTTTSDVEEGDKVIITKKFNPSKKELKAIVKEHNHESFRNGIKVGVHYVFELLTKHYNVEFPYDKETKKTIYPTLEQLIQANPTEYDKVLKEHLKTKKYDKKYIHLSQLNKDELRNLIQQEDKKRKENGTWTGASVLPKYSSKTKQELYDFLKDQLGYQP
jgi:hypothetical protein